MVGFGVMSAVYIFCFIFLLVLGVLAALMPIFVYRIKNEIVSMNKKIDRVIRAIEAKSSSGDARLTPTASISTQEDDRGECCPDCGDEYGEDYTNGGQCSNCGSYRR